MRDGEPTEDGAPTYIYNVYDVIVDNDPRYHQMDREVLVETIKNLCYTKAAAEVRSKRNKLLEESDQYMTIDRGVKSDFLGSGDITSSTMLPLFRGLLEGFRDLLSGDIARYRQDLRDLTKQEGFPYEVTFPSKPEGS